MKKIRYFIEAVFLALVLLISKLLPAPWASGLGGWIGRSVGPHLATSRKALTNIKEALPDADANKVLIGMWDNLGRIVMEYPHLKHIGRDRTKIIGAEILEQYKDKPAVLFSGHLGNWEACPPSLFLQLSFITSPIYRAPNNPFSDYMLQRARTVGGKLKTIPKSKSGSRQIVKALQENAHIGMLIDQKYNEGIAADFFGRPAMTSPIFIQLAQKFNCPLIPLRIERTKDANFRVTALPPLDIENKPVETVLDECHALLEEWIKERPEQWLWLHRRWKT